ncbi:gamma-glutamylcyclotransferase family protein [Nocardia arizonensis]|uniref:gamma-glutamylcyclotransferase family protein n=1 Tax=Nocardia arizonensis TaxID=1141647 RepID=UPI000A8B80D0|nr:gamma-glutamylcyclotransferase family protein [Nocardia arizonensis]
MVSRIVLLLLFPVAWPIYFVIWCIRHPDEIPHALRSVRDLVRRHPKRAAWLGVVFGVIGLIGHVADGEFLAMGLGAAVAGWCAWLLFKWRRQEARAAAAAPAKPESEIGRWSQVDEETAAPDMTDQAIRTDALFAYGTLQFPDVLREVIGRTPDSEPFAIHGWRVAALPGRVYPGLVPDPDAQAHGLLLTGLDPREWAILDAFEDAEYDLRRIDACDGSVLAYVWTAEVADRNWLPGDFAATHLAGFVAECGQWRAAS